MTFWQKLVLSRAKAVELGWLERPVSVNWCWNRAVGRWEGIAEEGFGSSEK